jgi:hypothetical protein
MKKTFKLILLCSLFFCSFSGMAQSALKDYLDSETKRIQKAQATEIEIEKFISRNIDGYALSQSVIDDFKYRTAEEGQTSSIDALLVKIKRAELRKLYFKEHPNVMQDYIAGVLPSALRQHCVNGDFETEVAANYTFMSEPIASNLECAVPTPQVPLAPTINDFGSLVTVMDSADSSWNAATMEFDPTLNSATYGFIQVPTISPNGAKRSIKLNNNAGGYDVTTMSRDIFIDDPFFEYEFSLMLQASGHLSTQEEPVFTVRIYDLSGNLIQQRCIISQPNCIFKVAHRKGFGNTEDIYYTDWMCDRMDVFALVDDKPNEKGFNARVEFTIADCGRGGHFGTAYIDNICDFTCSKPAFGSIETKPLEGDCERFFSDEPYVICGTYTLPPGSTLDSLAASMSINGGSVFVPIDPSDMVIDINPIDETSGTFCIRISKALLNSNPSETYVFQIIENYTQTCDSGSYHNVNTTIAVADFSKCCFPTLTLVSPSGDMTNNTADSVILKQRKEWIRAANLIGVGNNSYQDGVVYHAGDFVELNPGFEALLGSQFAAYPEDCSGTYVYRVQAPTKGKPAKSTEVNLVKIAKGFDIYPNPSSNSIEIVMKNTRFNKVTITSVDGKTVYENKMEANDRQQLSIQHFAEGIYIVNVTSEEGKVFTRKLIKN